MRHHRLPPKLLPVRVSGYAFNSHLKKIVFSLGLQICSHGPSWLGLQKPPGGLQGGLQGPPGWGLKRPGLGARTLEGPLRRWLKMWGRRWRDFVRGFGVFPSRGKSMYIVCIWLTPDARRGSIRPLSIGSSHCPTQYWCKG